MAIIDFAMPKPIGVLLAAGVGTRYDPAGRRLKLLQPSQKGLHVGLPIAAAAARNLRVAAERIVAVVRSIDQPHQPRLHELLTLEGCQLVVCENASDGIGTSLACAVNATQGAAGWIVALADMPEIDPATIKRVADALYAGHTTAAPIFRGQRGHPVGFAALCQHELLSCSGDEGARAVLRKFAPHLIEVDDAGVLVDIDHR